MGETAEAIIAAGLALDENTRAVVAQRLLESLHAEDDGDQDDVDAAWRDEVNSRVDDILNGKVELVSFEESQRRVHARLAELRK